MKLSSHISPIALSRNWLGLALGASLAFAGALAPVEQAQAVTAAEKQAEADAVFAQIDSLQTNLNKVMAEYETANAAYEEACAARDEAQGRIEAESAHIDEMQGELSQFAVGMYKKGGAGTFLDVMFGATSFNDFLSSWDACNAIVAQGANMLEESKAARAELERAESRFQTQSVRAEREMEAAAAAQAEIEQTQEALRSEAQQLSQEAAELQLQEELAAEAARQAEEARKQREAELAAAAEAARKAEEERAAEEARAAAEAQAAAENELQDQDGAWTDADAGEEPSDETAQDSAEDTSASTTLVMGPGYFTNPCPSATSSSGFGYRTFDNSFHKGLDMAAPEGTPYYAADSGTVMYATNGGGYNGGAGNWVVISHGNGVVTKYMHSSATYVQPGDYVERGQNIGAVGNTGQSFGAHLHFQVEVNGIAVNPLNYL